MDDEEDECREIFASSSEYREAKKVFLFMNKNVRVSRDVRARWFFEHLDKVLHLDAQSNNLLLSNSRATKTADSFGVEVIGLVPKTGPPLRQSEKLRVSSSTHISYFSKFYRFIFVLDFSPSCFVSDESGYVLYTKLVDSVAKCIKNVSKKFKFAGSNNIFIPQIYATFCAFTPFLCFPEDSVLLQSVLLNESNVENVVNFLYKKINVFINKLCIFTKPHMREWNKKRRQWRKNNDDSITNLFTQISESLEDPTSRFSVNKVHICRNTFSKSNSISLIDVSGNSMTDRGFIQPDWALIFMLRLGLMGVQMCLAENTQSNIIIVTDGVCGFPDGQALQHVLAQLRSFSISCSFIQLNQSLRGPTLGHVGFSELFHFLSTATFGSFLNENQLNDDLPPLAYNIFHKSFLAWSFQRALVKNCSLPNLIPEGLRTTFIRNRRMTRIYETSLTKLLYVRLREGFTIKHVEIQRRSEDVETITVKLSLEWEPQILIEYVINAPWKYVPEKKCKIYVDVFVETIANSTIEMFNDFQDSESIKSVILSLNDADCLLLHLNLFNCDSHYYTLPKEFDQSEPLFEYRKNVQKPILNQRYDNLKSSKFVSFWQPLCMLDEGIWQRWAHTHTIRVVLTHDSPLPDKIFTSSKNKGRYAEIFSESSFQLLHDSLQKFGTFTLVKEQSYVIMIYDKDKNVPKYFYIVKTSIEMSFMLIKVAFLGDVSGSIRNKIVDDLKKMLKSLTMSCEVTYINSAEAACSSPSDHNPLLCQTFLKITNKESLIVIDKPIERILIKYRRLPRVLHQIVRLEKSEKLSENREMILHNAISKYLSCRRQIWHLRGVFLKNMVMSNASLEFIMQTLLRRRLNQGFYIASGKNGVVNLVKQRNTSKTKSKNIRIEQCVLFGPRLIDNTAVNKNLIEKNRRKSCKDNKENNADEKFNTLDSSKSSLVAPWTQIVTEVWTEPRDCIEDNNESKYDTSDELLEENGIVIRTLFTFEQWLSACNSRIWIERPIIFDNNNNDSCNLDEILLFNKNSTNYQSFPAVNCFFNAFDLKELLEQANEKEVMFLPALGFSDSDPHSTTRLLMLLKKLQKEIADTYDACIEVIDECIPECVLITMQKHFYSDEFCKEELKTPVPAEQKLKSLNRKNSSKKTGDLNTIDNNQKNPAFLSFKPPLTPPLQNLMQYPGPFSQAQLNSSFVQCSSVSPPPSNHSSLSSPFETPIACSPNFLGSRFNMPGEGTNKIRPPFKDSIEYTQIEQSVLKFSPQNFDHSFFLDTMCEHRSTSVPVLSTTEKTSNAENFNTESFLPTPIMLNSNIGYGTCNSSVNQSSAFNPVLQKSDTRTLNKTPSNKWDVLSGKPRSTTTTPFLEPLKSISNVTIMESGPSGISETCGMRIQDIACVNKKHSAAAFSNDELSTHARISLRVPPTKKFSAPPPSSTCSNQQQKTKIILSNTPNNLCNCAQCANNFVTKKTNYLETDLQPRNGFLKLFAKRLNDYRIILFMIPKDVKSIQIISPIAVQNNMFPVFVFHCDKARIAQRLSFNDLHLSSNKNNSDEVFVESFCRKSETSTLAHLRQQIKRREKREQRKTANAQNLLESFYATINVSAPIIGRFSSVKDISTEQNGKKPIYTSFDLANYCELVFEEYIYTKCYIATVYSCLGQEIFVPPFVLLEVMEYRCEHVRIDVGSINEILNDTCVHIKKPLCSSKKSTRQRKKSQKLFSSSSSSSSVLFSSSATQDSDSEEFNDLFRSTPIPLPTSANKQVSGVLFKENGECEWECDSDKNNKFYEDFNVVCEDELSDFRQSFDDLLKQHLFVKVPGLADYFFYWPQQSAKSYQMMCVDPNVEDLSCSMSVDPKKHFSRSDSIQNSSMRSRKTSASASTITKRRSTKNSDHKDSESFALARQSSMESWDVEYFECSDENAESDKSSLSNELLGTNNWPMFIQFAASVYINGQVYSFSIEFIPNCLKDIFKKCSSLLNGNQLVDLSNIDVNIEMYVFTWPLLTQCPYQEGAQFYENCSANASGFCGRATTDGGGDSFQSSLNSAEFSNFQKFPCKENFGHLQTSTEKYSIIRGSNIVDDNDDIFEQPAEIVRQIPVQEHRVLRKVQRNIQRMLKMEYILIMSREFDKKPKLSTLRRVIRFISEEIGHTNKISHSTDSNDRRFKMVIKELVLVSDPQLGLNRLCNRFSNLKFDYFTLKRFSSAKIEPKATKPSFDKSIRKRVSKFLNEKIEKEHDILFYLCGVDSANEIALTHTRHKHLDRSEFQASDESEFITIPEDDFAKPKVRSESSIPTLHKQSLHQSVKHDKAETHCMSNSTTKISAFDKALYKNIDDYIENSNVDDVKIISDITMPLNDSNPHNSVNNVSQAKGACNQFHNCRKYLMHDFWLILQVTQKEDGSVFIKIYFCQRSPLIQMKLFSKACQIVDEQIKIVNQELLLEKMHKTEECDQLLVDNDSVHNLTDYHYQHKRVRDALSGDSQFEPVLSKHAAKFAHRPTSLSLGTTNNWDNNNASYSDDDNMDIDSNIGEFLRYKFSPGFFSCDMVWHCWFPIHPRLKPTRPFGGSDIGFKALRLGLEGLAVRNRSNMYVYREQSGNVVYMRLHSSEESVFFNITLKTEKWKEEVMQNINSCILLSVHGVRPPGEEITEQLCNVLQRRLNSKTLEEIQNALLKNAHICLEWSDIKFIQRDSQNPTSIFYFTIPAVAQNHLLSVQYYLTQQLQTFCISPKFREQSGLYGAQNYSLSSLHPPLIGHSSNSDFLSFLAGPNSELKRSYQSEVGTPPPQAAPLSFLPYIQPNMPSNPPNYVPNFFLVNKPSGEGKRDTGIACFEAKLIEWNGNVLEKFEESCFNQSNRSLLYPGVLNADRLHRAARFHELSKCIQIANLFDRGPIPGTCALFQFNMWKNGNAEIDELQARLKMCVHQAISDLITEFGLLSAPLFESTLRFRSTFDSFCCPAPSSLNLANSSSNFSGNTPKVGVYESNTTVKINNLHRQNAQDLDGKGLYTMNTSTEVATSNAAVESTSKFSTLTTSIKPSKSADTLQAHCHTRNESQIGVFPPLKSTCNIDQSSLFFKKEENLNFCDFSQIPLSPVSSNVYIAIEGAGNPQSNSILSNRSSLISATISTDANAVTVAASRSQEQAIPSVGQSSQNFYQYFHSATKLSPCNTAWSTNPVLTSSGTFVNGLSSTSAFVHPSHNAFTGTGIPASIVPFSLQTAIGFNNPGYGSIADVYLGQIPTTQQPVNNNNVGSSSACSFDTVRQIQRDSSASEHTLVMNEILRIDFVAAAAEWFDHVNSETKGFPEMSHSVRKFNFLLDCDGSAGKIIQVIYDRMKHLLKSEKIVICKSSIENFHNNKRLKTLLSVTSLLEPFDKDFGRVVNIDKDYTADLVLVAFSEQQYLDTLNYGQNSTGSIPDSLLKLADGTQNIYSKFLPSLRPFVPRQRIIYLLLRGENITLFLYNYVNEVVVRIKEIVERAILWHNARSRLLREIGLHKMGVTHLSTLKNFNSKFNSYLLLTWMDPETLVQNEYPVESLTTPDFSKLPRLYSQFLLKLYRFSDPAFVAKNLNAYPFEDQTQQMLTLRKDVRSMLNDQRLFQEIHKFLLNGCSTLSEESFNRIINRSRQVHFVQSPLLLFSGWRRIVASIRTGFNSCRKHSFSSLSNFSTTAFAAGDFPRGRSKTIVSEQHEYRNTGNVPSSIDKEPCLLKIQQMLIDDYIAYLNMIGLNIINIVHSNKKSNSAFKQNRSTYYSTLANLSTKNSGSRACSTSTSLPGHDFNKNMTSPNVWLYLAHPGGILFIQLCFVEPYFCVRFLQWNNCHLLVTPHSETFKTELENLKNLEKKKNEILQKCHVHSFTYDFHLRIVARYLVGGSQVLFNPGYNTNAFLIDFLQYYECRPPYARNCIYEETVNCDDLQVNHSSIWEYFLDNEQQFQWNILETNSCDQFMLVSRENTELLNQPYKSIRVVLNGVCRRADAANVYHVGSGSNCSETKSGTLPSQMPSSTSKDHYNISVKFYLMLVAKNLTHPIIENVVDKNSNDPTVDSRQHNSSGEFKHISLGANFKKSLVSPIFDDEKNFCEVNNKLLSDDNQEMSTSLIAFNDFKDHEKHRNAKFLYCSECANEEEQQRAQNQFPEYFIGQSMNASAIQLGESLTISLLENRKRFSSGGNFISAFSRRQTSFKALNLQHKFSIGDNTSQNSTTDIGSRRNSDSPSSLLPAFSGALPTVTKFFFLNTVPGNVEGEINDLVSGNTKNLTFNQQQISFQKISQHRQFFNLARISNFHNRGAVVPSEQVIYLHYFSSVQRKLQAFLENAVSEKRAELIKFIYEADNLCYIDMLWKSLLSSKSTHIRRQATLFSAINTSKSELLSGNLSDLSAVLSFQKSLTSSGSVEMDFSYFDALLKVIRIEPMILEEPRLQSILIDVNFASLCRFLLNYYEGERRCRYFAQGEKTYLIITNPSFLDSAAMFQNESNKTEMFFLFKNTSIDKLENEPFSTNAIHKQFEDVMSCLSAYIWSELLRNPPTLL